MWNLSYQNSICNQLEKINEQRLHINRLLNVKGITNTASPIKPKFLKSKLKKKDMENEEKKKIEYENKNLYHKLINVDIKPSKYSVMFTPKECPAFNKEKMYTKRMNKVFNNFKDNVKLHQKLLKVKSNYDAREIYRSTAMYDDIVKRIKKTNRVLHPCLYFKSPRYIKRLFENSSRNLYSEVNSNSMCHSNTYNNEHNNNSNKKKRDKTENKLNENKLKRTKSAILWNKNNT